MITAESGKIIGEEIHKSRIEVKTGEEGRYGAISRPKLHLSVVNLLITLSSKTIGGKGIHFQAK